MPLRRNLVFLYTAEGLAKALGMLVFGYLSRILGENRYGDIEFALAAFFILNLVMEAGLSPFGAREASQRPDQTESLANRIAFLRVGIVGLGILILGGFVALIHRDPVAERLVLLYGLVLLPGPLIVNWVFQARGEMGVVAFSSILRQVAFATGVFVLVRSPDDVLRVPVCEVAGVLVVVILHQVFYRRRVGVLQPLRGIRGSGHVLRQSLPIAGSSIAWALRLFFPILAIGLFTGSAETAQFACGHRLVVAIHAFVWLYFFNLLPSISRAAARDNPGDYRRLLSRSVSLVAWCVIPAGLLGTILAPMVIPTIYGSALSGGSEPFATMVWMLAFAFISGHHRYALLAHGHQKDEFLANGIGAVVSIAGCLAFSADLSPMVAAIILVVAEAVTLAVAMVLLARRVEHLALMKPLVRPLLIGGAGFFAVTRGLPDQPLAASAVIVAVFLVATLVNSPFSRRPGRDEEPQ